MISIRIWVMYLYRMIRVLVQSIEPARPPSNMKTQVALRCLASNKKSVGLEDLTG